MPTVSAGLYDFALDEATSRNELPKLTSTKSMKNLSLSRDRSESQNVYSGVRKTESTRTHYANHFLNKSYKHRTYKKYNLPKPPRKVNLIGHDLDSSDQKDVNLSVSPHKTNGMEFSNQ